MKQIKITDVSLYEAQKKGERAYSFKEQIELAKVLDKLNVDCIKLSPIVSLKADTTAIRTLATVVKGSTLALPCASLSTDAIDAAWNAIQGAKKSALVICAPTSVVQMEYFFHNKPDKMVDAIVSAITYAKTLTPNVIFEAQDATRSEVPFLCRVLQSATEAGATSVILCDASSTLLPDAFSAWVKEVYAAYPALSEVNVSIQCANDLSMASACAIGALCAGANGVCVSALSADSAPSLESIAEILRRCGDGCKMQSNIAITQLQRSLQQLQLLLRRAGARPASTSEGGDFEHLELDAHSDIATVTSAVRELGYDLAEEDLSKVYASVCDVAKQKTVGAKELDAIIASVALQVPPTYILESYVINSGSAISATAALRMTKNGEALSAVCAGHGPIDAAFAAIDSVIGHHYELDDFQIQSVTEGSEAIGSALVRLRADGKLYSGSGISTDIIGASISAYVNAINKIAYEENV